MSGKPQVQPAIGAAEAGGPCANCGAALSGAYCASCGQSAQFHRSLGHMFEEMLHGVAHFDTRAWRTLPMLVLKPGRLTREYIYGRRARYISPLALFLFLVFTMYIVFTAMGGASVGVDAPPADPIEAQIEAAMGDEPASDEPVAADREDIIPSGAFEMISAAARNGELNINTGSAWLDKKIIEKLKDPAFAIYKIQNAAYKFSFLLVPISLPFLWLIFFWKKGVTLFDHCAFILYSLSFVSLLMLVTSIVSRVAPPMADLAGMAFTLWPPVHIYVHLKDAYKLGWLSALWRTIFVIFTAFFCLSLFTIVMMALGILT